MKGVVGIDNLTRARPSLGHLNRSSSKTTQDLFPLAEQAFSFLRPPKEFGDVLLLRLPPLIPFVSITTHGSLDRKSVV